MASTTTTRAPFEQETTFSKYNHEQGKQYAAIRRNYDPSLYQAVLDYHSSTGGKFDTLLDVGCGPGLAAYSLAPHFTTTIGLDPSEGMLSNARAIGGADSPVRFEISTAEELGAHLTPPIADNSVDLITASNAAHWFNMEGFWPRAAQVLKPGGTVALWCSGEIRVNPDMPNGEKLQTAMDDHYERHLKPYQAAGSQLTRGRYRDLLLPWTLDKPVAAFPESEFIRKEWQPGEPFFTGSMESNFDTFEQAISTSSGVTRWRQANPSLVGTEDDVVRLLRREMEGILHEAGVQPGQETLRGHVLGVLLIVKKRK